MVSDDDSIQSIGFSFGFERPDIDWEHVMMLAVGGGTIGVPLLVHGGLEVSQLAYLVAVFPLLYVVLLGFFAYSSE